MCPDLKESDLTRTSTMYLKNDNKRKQGSLNEMKRTVSHTVHAGVQEATNQEQKKKTQLDGNNISREGTKCQRQMRSKQMQEIRIRQHQMTTKRMQNNPR